jgi:hypothetical protein
MAQTIEPTPETLLRIQTELQLVRAAMADLQLKVRQGQLIDRSRYEQATVAAAHRVRDQFLTAPTRHAALLAAEFDLPLGPLSQALEDFVRSGLIDTAKRPRPAF